MTLALFKSDKKACVVDNIKKHLNLSKQLGSSEHYMLSFTYRGHINIELFEQHPELIVNMLREVKYKLSDKVDSDIEYAIFQLGLLK
jgi:hypothetical protein